ncbi:MobC family plasmid mobilization relaxosome protein [Streptomyces sp. HPF1205]|uniref:MobC family plasmid mobilization relaxosome protein n=1 Tax=Streptomyces sp. HPF1205 TaxID=2873262 RepID=UPI001CED5856|nr:MobC family plasmid mobilization relaxosome protein [Streptomyces sp. HPF1205]
MQLRRTGLRTPQRGDTHVVRRSSITSVPPRRRSFPRRPRLRSGPAAGQPRRQPAQVSSDELAALRTAVSRVGNNINQIAHVYNSGGLPVPGELAHALRALVAVLARIDAVADALVDRRR